MTARGLYLASFSTFYFYVLCVHLPRPDSLHDVFLVGCVRCNCNMSNTKLSCRRDRATLRVIEYFAKSLKITQGHSKGVYKSLLIFIEAMSASRTVSEIFSV